MTRKLAVVLLALAVLPWAYAQDRDSQAQDKDQAKAAQKKKDKDKDRKAKASADRDRDQAKPCQDRDDCPQAATQDRDRDQNGAATQDRDRDRERNGAAANGQFAAVHIANGPRIEGVHPTRAQIAWSTNVPASTILRYGTDPNNLNQTAEAAWGGGKERNGDVVHRVELRNLRPNTTYYFRVDSTQAKGTGTAVQSSVQSFHTPAGSSARR